MNLQINIEEIKSIKLNKNEHLVFKLNNASLEEAKAFKKQISKALPKIKDRIAVISGDVEITKVTV